MPERHGQVRKGEQEYDYDLEKSIWDWLQDPEIKGYVYAIRDEFLESHYHTEDKEAMIEYVYNEIIKKFPGWNTVPPKYLKNVLRLSFV